MLHRLEQVGIQVGSTFDVDTAPPAIRAAFEKGIEQGKAPIERRQLKETGADQKGWAYTTDSGAYGVNYLHRAALRAASAKIFLKTRSIRPPRPTAKGSR
jgi:hypothetical protein